MTWLLCKLSFFSIHGLDRPLSLDYNTESLSCLYALGCPVGNLRNGKIFPIHNAALHVHYKTCLSLILSIKGLNTHIMRHSWVSIPEQLSMIWTPGLEGRVFIWLKSMHLVSVLSKQRTTVLHNCIVKHGMAAKQAFIHYHSWPDCLWIEIQGCSMGAA